MKRLTVSLPDDLAKKVKRISEETGLKVSRIVAQALEERIIEEEEPSQAPIHPAALWKLKGRKSLSGPSLRLTRNRVGSWRVIDLDKISV